MTPKTSPEGHDRRDVPRSCRARSPALHVGGRDRVASWSWSVHRTPHAHLHAQLGLISASAAPSAVIYHRRRRARWRRRGLPGSAFAVHGPLPCCVASLAPGSPRFMFALVPRLLALGTPARLLGRRLIARGVARPLLLPRPAVVRAARSGSAPTRRLGVGGEAVHVGTAAPATRQRASPPAPPRWAVRAHGPVQRQHLPVQLWRLQPKASRLLSELAVLVRSAQSQ